MAFEKLMFLLALSLAFTPLGVSSASARYQQGAYVLACGEVNKPGTIPFTEGMSLSHALVLFDGMTANADVSRVMVLGRNRGRTIDALAMNGTNEVELQAGDVIAVPSFGKQQFFATGEVNTPGVFDWREGLTLRAAARLFEDPTKNASLARTFIVRKSNIGGRPIVIPVNIGAVMRGEIEDVPILADDIILIKEFGVSSKP
ncbi:MAG TPA: SLBB domain-containing protein [Blastocatellia bacterium]|nr:SLBB domain-containing protein [Blastocatellia bacterium]